MRIALTRDGVTSAGRRQEEQAEPFSQYIASAKEMVAHITTVFNPDTNSCSASGC